MSRSSFISLLLLSCSAPAWGQWALGPQVDLALFKGSPRYIAYGIGASATYQPSKRNVWTVDAVYHIPHVDHFIRVQDPRGLAMGDTTSSTWNSNLHESHFSVAFSLQRTFNAKQRPKEWYWKVATGLGMDRRRTEGEVTYKYSGEQRPFEYSSHITYIPLLVGAGRILHLERADLAWGLSGMLPCILISDPELGALNGDYSLYLTLQYRWRI